MLHKDVDEHAEDMRTLNDKAAHLLSDVMQDSVTDLSHRWVSLPYITEAPVY